MTNTNKTDWRETIINTITGEGSADVDSLHEAADGEEELEAMEAAMTAMIAEGLIIDRNGELTFARVRFESEVKAEPAPVAPEGADKAVELKEFAKEDWYGFAGAERFPDGSEPLLAFIKVDGEDGTVIVDANGLGLEVTDEEGQILGFYTWSGAFAARAVGMLRQGMTTAQLKALPGIEVHDGV